jgi:hypothetical protein
LAFQLASPDKDNTWLTTPYGLRRFDDDSGNPRTHQVIRLLVNGEVKGFFDKYDEIAIEAVAGLSTPMHKSFGKGTKADRIKAVRSQWQPTVKLDDDGQAFITCKAADPGAFAALDVLVYDKRTQEWDFGTADMVVSSTVLVPVVMPLVVWTQTSGTTGLSLRLVKAMVDSDNTVAGGGGGGMLMSTGSVLKKRKRTEEPDTEAVATEVAAETPSLPAASQPTEPEAAKKQKTKKGASAAMEKL